jgi:hypothetical protein
LRVPSREDEATEPGGLEAALRDAILGDANEPHLSKLDGTGLCLVDVALSSVRGHQPNFA